MRPAKVRYSATATNDLDHAYFAVLELSQSVRSAETYVQRLRERCTRIADVPNGGRPRDDLADGIRTVHFKRSAVIAYRIVRGEVLIINIFYAGEDYAAVLRGERPRGAAEDN